MTLGLFMPLLLATIGSEATTSNSKAKWHPKACPRDNGKGLVQENARYSWIFRMYTTNQAPVVDAQRRQHKFFMAFCVVEH